MYVSLAQRKEDRKVQLALQYMQRLAAIRLQNPGAVSSAMYNTSNSGFFAPSTLQSQRAMSISSHVGRTDTCWNYEAFASNFFVFSFLFYFSFQVIFLLFE